MKTVTVMQRAHRYHLHRISPLVGARRQLAAFLVAFALVLALAGATGAYRSLTAPAEEGAVPAAQAQTATGEWRWDANAAGAVPFALGSF